MVDLIFRVHGAGAGDEVVAPGQGFGADELQQKPRHCAVIVPDELETYYRAAVDFGKVDAAAKECIRMFELD